MNMSNLEIDPEKIKTVLLGYSDLLHHFCAADFSYLEADEVSQLRLVIEDLNNAMGAIRTFTDLRKGAQGRNHEENIIDFNLARRQRPMEIKS